MFHFKLFFVVIFDSNLKITQVVFLLLQPVRAPLDSTGNKEGPEPRGSSFVSP